MSEERVFLTTEEAIAMLPDGDSIHTFRQAGAMLLGADWDREKLITAMRKYATELSGETATRMKHGIVFCDDRGFVFVQTR